MHTRSLVGGSSVIHRTSLWYCDCNTIVIQRDSWRHMGWSGWRCCGGSLAFAPPRPPGLWLGQGWRTGVPRRGALPCGPASTVEVACSRCRLAGIVLRAGPRWSVRRPTGRSPRARVGSCWSQTTCTGSRPPLQAPAGSLGAWRGAGQPRPRPRPRPRPACPRPRCRDTIGQAADTIGQLNEENSTSTRARVPSTATTKRVPKAL